MPVLLDYLISGSQNIIINTRRLNIFWLYA